MRWKEVGPVIFVAAVIAVSLRLMDRPLMNFSAMGAFALLCGRYVSSPGLGIAIVLGVRLLTDVVLQVRTGYGFYGSITFDYAAYAAVFWLGRSIRPSRMTITLASAVLSAAVFFLISNLGVWCMPHNGQYLYPRTLAGLVDCYTKGLPFARGTIAGDIVFSLAFFAAARLFVADSAAKPSAARSENVIEG
jgi:hypothetical protein